MTWRSDLELRPLVRRCLAGEQQAMLALVERFQGPDLLVFRPGDASKHRRGLDCASRAQTSPSMLCLSRQAMPTFRELRAVVNLVALRAYVIVEPQGGRDVTLIATGSEVSIALDSSQAARERQCARGGRFGALLRLVSTAIARIPHRGARSVPRIGVEAAVEGDWARWLGDSGEFVGMKASAPPRRPKCCTGDSESPRRRSLRQRNVVWRDRRS